MTSGVLETPVRGNEESSPVGATGPPPATGVRVADVIPPRQESSTALAPRTPPALRQELSGDSSPSDFVEHVYNDVLNREATVSNVDGVRYYASLIRTSLAQQIAEIEYWIGLYRCCCAEQQNMSVPVWERRLSEILKGSASESDHGESSGGEGELELGGGYD